ncbi:MAG: ABC transporter ATP-binding protein [Proteobacteria bacterium]|jgi:branched-chain amino acid transport system ATP-binding protein|nr:ABC transporter ATP-binding protein [Pseudomonadota bacterium]
MSLLEVDNLSLYFGGIRALNRIHLRVGSGAITTIIGPNGAGKTTLFNCITGLYRPNHGGITFEEKDLVGLKPHQIASLGIARTFQNIELFSYMTTLENLLLGRHLHLKTTIFGGFCFTPWVRRDEYINRDRVEDIIDFLDLQSARDQMVINLPYGTRKLIELGRALALDPKILLLDEPSSGMNIEERRDLTFWLQDILEEFNITILMVEHDMNLTMAISDWICVLDHGEKISEGNPGQIMRDPEVIKAYLGEEKTVA